MRSPIEIWIREHREMIRHTDELVELLAPSDIQARLTDPSENALRITIARHLNAFVDFADGHFRKEEEYLVPLISKHLDTGTPEMKEALGCMQREHAQMHLFADRIQTLLPALESGDKVTDGQAAELLRISYGIQSIIRNHTSKEEQQVFPLVQKLPLKAATELFNALEESTDMNLDHLVKPLGDNVEGVNPEGIESPDN